MDLMLRRIAIAGLAALALFYTIVFIQVGTIFFFEIKAMKELVFVFIFLLVTFWTHEKVAAYFNRNREKFINRRVTAFLEAVAVIIISSVYSVLFTFLPQYLFIETVEFTPRGIRLALVMAAILSLFIYYFVERERGKYQLQEEISKAEQLRAENFKAQLETIKSQIDPHFLFNSLNVLSSLVHRNPDKATEFLEQLSIVYRIILDSRRKTLSSLKAEMELVKAYAFLMSTRFGSSLVFEINLPLSIVEIYVPPATIQMLVENAIKHNAFTKEDPLEIKIYIEEDTLAVENNIQPKVEVEDSPKVGLGNIISRYKLLTNREVEIFSTENRFIVRLPLLKKVESMDIVIIEDEELAVDILADTITELRPGVRILKSLGSIKEAVKWFENNNLPDLIFCDIHLSDGKSFEIFKRINVKSPVIFTTAYDQYAIEAFKVNSIDYLLKPIKKEDVENSLKKFEELQKEQLSMKLENMQNLLGSISKPKNFKKRFVVKQGINMRTIPSEDVAGFLAEEGLVFLYNFTGQRFIVNSTLEQLEEEVEDSKFFRINRKFIINVDAIEQVKPYFNTRLIIKSIPPLNFEEIVSTKRVTDFKKWLDY